MNRSVLGFAGLPLILFCYGVHAQDVTIASGVTRAIVSGTEPITVTAAPARGAVTLAESQQTPKSYFLLYTAPATTSAFTESIGYSNPAPAAVRVTVIPDTSELVYSEAFKALFVVFVVAILLESGLAVLFNWRPFVVTFDGRGVKTLVSVVVAYVFVEQFDLDLVTRLVNVYSGTADTDSINGGRYLGKFITALVIAGGSAAVNNLFVALGFRSMRTADEMAPKPPKTEGWISVTFKRMNAVGPVDVLIGKPDATKGPPVAGSIPGGARRSPIARLFLRDRNRFPMSGGFAVPAGESCEVRVEGQDKASKPCVAKWGPKDIAPGAIIDLELEC